MTAQEKQPWDVTIEQSVIGSILRDNVLLDIARSDIDAETFYDPLHQRIFSTMLERRNEGVLTPRTLYSFLADDAGLTEAGGLDYLDSMRLVGSDKPPMRQYVGILKEFKLKRLAMQDLEDALWSLKYTSQPVAKAIRSVVAVADQAAQAETRARPVPAEDVARRVMAQQEAAHRGEHIPFVTTGSQKLDDATGGMQAGDFIVLPARSGMGKTSLLAGICLRAAMAGHPVLFFELEMMADQLMPRWLSDLDYDNAPVPMSYGKFRKGTLTAEELDRAARAATMLNNLPLEICDAGDMTAEDIGARARAFKARHPGKLGLIAVDYLQRVHASAHQERSREQEVAHVARSLKTLAKALGWPVAAAAQLLNKGGDPKQVTQEVVPTLAAIRDTGQIEMEADIIFAPHRKAWFLRKQKPVDSPDDSPEMIKWRGDYRACRNILHGYGLKNRNGAEFDLDLFCDMRASAIRDEEPRISLTQADRDARDLLEGY